jgi:hypothetical protein
LKTQVDVDVEIALEKAPTIIIIQDTLKATNYSLASLPLLNMNMENPSEPKNMASHILPSSLKLDVVLQDLHTLKDIQGAQNHYLILVEAEVDQHVTIPWEPPIPLPIKLTTWLV